jgi:hypothetical protein
MPDVLSRLNAALSGRYNIERQLGEGGMATVYLARDLKHNRNVALKVLKPELAAVVGAERFLSEIQTTANLQHPNILPLYDSGEADSFLYYVMPYVEGETLRDRLDQERQLPVSEAVRIATAVAAALDFAHEHGVVHRDIKPGNILFQAGQPVVGDFGIALAVGAGGGARLTETGLSVGTPYYMSPEQATGDQRVGAQSDIYSLGCVLYEMLVGDPPYTGSTAQAVLGQIISGKPVTATEHRAAVPANVDAVLRKSLEKVAADRFATADEMASALEDPNFRHGVAPGAVDPIAAGRLKWVSVAGWGVAAVLAVVLAVVATRPEPRMQAGRFAIPTADGGFFFGAATLLPDGSGMIWRAPGPSGQRMLWVRHWDETEGTPVRGTEGVGTFGANVSPDETEIVFNTGNASPLRVAPLRGGAVRTVADSSWIGGLWSNDGSAIYYTDNQWGISRVPAEGGESSAVVQGAYPDSVWVPLAILPGERILLARHFEYPSVERSWIEAVDLEAGVTTVVTPGTDPVAVTRSGHLIFGTPDGALMGAPFDAGALELTSAAAVLVEGIGTHSIAESPLASVSASGTLLYLPGTAEAELTPVWVDRAGRMDVIDPDWHFPGATVETSVALSPDGTRLAVTELDERWDVYVKELDDGPRTRLTVEGGRRATWSSDGQSLYFLTSRDGTSDVWVRTADASRAPQMVLNLEEQINEAFPLADGSIVFRQGTSTGGGTDSDIFMLGPPGDTTITPLVDGDFLEWQAAVSPDGGWLAYSSNESGRPEVYVRPFPNTQDRRWQVSVDGGEFPVWSRDGGELFFVGAGELVAAAVTTTPTFAVTGRTPLFGVNPFYLGIGHALYDVSPDGRRFVMLRAGEGERYPAILIQNWLADVDGRLGG